MSGFKPPPWAIAEEEEKSTEAFKPPEYAQSDAPVVPKPDAPKAKAEAPSVLESVWQSVEPLIEPSLRGAGQGFTSFGSDEGTGSVQAIGGSLIRGAERLKDGQMLRDPRDEAKDVRKDYSAARDSERRANKAAAEAHPIAYGVSNVLAGIPAAVVAGPMGMSPLGALTSFLASEDDLTTVEGRENAKNAVKGGVAMGPLAARFPGSATALSGGLALFGDKIGMTDADRVAAGAGVAMAAPALLRAGAGKLGNYLASKAEGVVSAATAEARGKIEPKLNKALEYLKTLGVKRADVLADVSEAVPAKIRKQLTKTEGQLGTLADQRSKHIADKADGLLKDLDTKRTTKTKAALEEMAEKGAAEAKALQDSAMQDKAASLQDQEGRFAKFNELLKTEGKRYKDADDNFIAAFLAEERAKKGYVPGIDEGGVTPEDRARGLQGKEIQEGFAFLRSKDPLKLNITPEAEAGVANILPDYESKANDFLSRYAGGKDKRFDELLELVKSGGTPDSPRKPPEDITQATYQLPHGEPVQSRVEDLVPPDRVAEIAKMFGFDGPPDAAQFDKTTVSPSSAAPAEKAWPGSLLSRSEKAEIAKKFGLDIGVDASPDSEMGWLSRPTETPSAVPEGAKPKGEGTANNRRPSKAPEAAGNPWGSTEKPVAPVAPDGLAPGDSLPVSDASEAFWRKEAELQSKAKDLKGTLETPDALENLIQTAAAKRLRTVDRAEAKYGAQAEKLKGDIENLKTSLLQKGKQDVKTAVGKSFTSPLGSLGMTAAGGAVGGPVGAAVGAAGGVVRAAVSEAYRNPAARAFLLDKVGSVLRNDPKMAQKYAGILAAEGLRSASPEVAVLRVQKLVDVDPELQKALEAELQAQGGGKP